MQSEVNGIHKYFTERTKYEQDKEYINIQDTILEKTLPMHFSNKNIHGHIFGGYIIREAFELGYLSALMISQGRIPNVQFIDDF